MSGLQEVDCGACGRLHQTSAEQARAQRVTRCACGQFVRLDRALVERRSEPAPAPVPEPMDADDQDDDEATHMLQSLSDVAALRGQSAARASLASLHGDERPSRPVPHSNMLRSLSPAPLKRPSAPPSDNPPSDKPLWYVDLGGTETVEMTIEQLIVARRSGKLGEGALVWREGMPRWRPVGTLIPATSVTDRPAPLPPAPSRPSAPARASAPIRTPVPRIPTPPPAPLPLPRPAPLSLSYERPAATLEFALEKAASRAAVREPSSSALPSKGARPSSPVRSLTPAPRPQTWTASSVTRAPTPVPAPPIAARAPTPVPAPPVIVAEPMPQPAAEAATTPSAPVSFSTDHATQLPAAYPALATIGERPRWVSACIALLVCITASSAGAFVVRSLKLHRQSAPLAVSSVAAQAPVSPLSTARAEQRSPNTAANAPLVVDLQSLKVEPRRARVTARPTAAVVSKPALDAETAATPADDNAAPSPQKVRNSALPSAAHSNPYTTGSDEPGL